MNLNFNVWKLHKNLGCWVFLKNWSSALLWVNFHPGSNGWSWLSPKTLTLPLTVPGASKCMPMHLLLAVLHPHAAFKPAAFILIFATLDNCSLSSHLVLRHHNSVTLYTYNGNSSTHTQKKLSSYSIVSIIPLAGENHLKIWIENWN